MPGRLLRRPAQARSTLRRFTGSRVYRKLFLTSRLDGFSPRPASARDIAIRARFERVGSNTWEGLASTCLGAYAFTAVAAGGDTAHFYRMRTLVRRASPPDGSGLMVFPARSAAGEMDSSTTYFDAAMSRGLDCQPSMRLPASMRSSAIVGAADKPLALQYHAMPIFDWRRPLCAKSARHADYGHADSRTGSSSSAHRSRHQPPLAARVFLFQDFTRRRR